MVQSVPVYLTSVRCSCIQFSASPLWLPRKSEKWQIEGRSSRRISATTTKQSQCGNPWGPHQLSISKKSFPSRGSSF